MRFASKCCQKPLPTKHLLVNETEKDGESYSVIISEAIIWTCCSCGFTLEVKAVAECRARLDD